MQQDDSYHVHVYFDADTRQTAEQVIDKVSSIFPMEVGHYHDKLVGPHPMGSCQLSVAIENLGAVIDWLAKNRQGLTIFMHANTGDVYRDHTDHTIWMGKMMELDLEFLRRIKQAG